MPERNRAETRRSGRVTLRVPLKIYERGSNKPFLVEEAYAVNVSLWGGLIAFGAAVDRDQKLFVFNQATGEIAESQILSAADAASWRARSGCHKVHETVAWFLGRGLSQGRPTPISDWPVCQLESQRARDSHHQEQTPGKSVHWTTEKLHVR